VVWFIAGQIARDARQGSPDRRCGVVALRAHASVRDRLPLPTAQSAPRCRRPRVSPVGTPRQHDCSASKGWTTAARTSPSAGRSGRRCHAPWTPASTAGSAAQPVPHPRRVRQSTLRRPAAAARRRRADGRPLWLPVVPAAGGVRGSRRAGADGRAPARCERPLRATKVRWVARTLDVPQSAGVGSLC